METLEQLKEIVKNAPEDATHCNDVGEYGLYAAGDYFSRWTPGDMNPTVNCNWRSLSDIKRIIELMEAVDSLKANTVNCNGGVKCSNIPNNLAM